MAQKQQDPTLSHKEAAKELESAKKNLIGSRERLNEDIRKLDRYLPNETAKKNLILNHVNEIDRKIKSLDDYAAILKEEEVDLLSGKKVGKVMQDDIQHIVKDAHNTAEVPMIIEDIEKAIKESRPRPIGKLARVGAQKITKIAEQIPYGEQAVDYAKDTGKKATELAKKAWNVVPPKVKTIAKVAGVVAGISAATGVVSKGIDLTKKTTVGIKRTAQDTITSEKTYQQWIDNLAEKNPKYGKKIEELILEERNAGKSWADTYYAIIDKFKKGEAAENKYHRKLKVTLNE